MSNDANLKERIRRGDIVIGVGIPIGSTKSQFEDILGKDDYGFATCDSQHSPFSEHMLVDHCNIADEVGIPVHFRIKHTQFAFLVGNIADLGPAFIEIPLVEEQSTVRDATDWFYFPPEGRRSWVGGSRWGAELDLDRPGYAKWWNESGILCLQIESLRAIENVKNPRHAGRRPVLVGAGRSGIRPRDAPPSPAQDRRRLHQARHGSG